MHILVCLLLVLQSSWGLHQAPTTMKTSAILRLARRNQLPATAAVLFSNAAMAVAVAEPVDVFKPVAETSLFGAVYLLGAVVPYFVFNAFIAPKLGMVKEVPEESNNSDANTNNNKTPF